MTAQEIIQAIRSAAPLPQLPLPRGLEGKAPKEFPTCDVIHYGDPGKEVHKIATTFMATVDVIREAARQQVDMIITHEPTFHTGLPSWDWLEGSPVYEQKKHLLNESGILVWRFHDGMHMSPGLRTDLIYAGWNQEFGWEAYHGPQVGMGKHEYRLPATTVGELVALFKRRLHIPTIRVIGRADTPVETLGLLVGGGSLGLGDENMPSKLMLESGLDLLICGEIIEWTSCSYVRDAAQLGLNKAMIVLGHNRTEEPGMKHLPAWLKTVLPAGLEYTFIEAGDPFDYL